MEIIKLPMIGLSEESAILTKWYKRVGDPVAVGDMLFSVETGKSSYDVAAEVEGLVLVLLEEEGEELPIEAPVCVIGGKDEKYEGTSKAADAEVASAEVPATDVVPVSTPGPAIAGTPMAATSASAASVRSEGFIAASPRAKRLAEKADIDLALVAPSSPVGRIVEADVKSVIESGTSKKGAAASVDVPNYVPVPVPVPAYTDVKITTIRKMIAKNMHASMSQMAQSSLAFSFDATSLLEARKIFKASDNSAISSITIGEMVLFGIANTVLEFPEFNAHYLEELGVIRQFADCNLGVAVDTPGGLMVPVLFGANKMRLSDLAAQMKELVNGCMQGNIDSALIQGASITVSNMGAFGTESFTPIVNPPQTCIIGICSIQYRNRPSKDGGYEVYPAMGISITGDHRAVDGAPGGRFSQKLSRNLENFTALMA